MQANSKIAVVGATGRVGRPAVEVLEARGYDVVPMSRSTGVDVVTGEGLADAMTGVGCIIDVATGPSPEQEAATQFFMASSKNLLEAGERAGVQRLVRVSIVGSERFGGGYGAAMVALEQALLAGAIPVRVLRATQFFEFVGQLIEWGRHGDVSYVENMRMQPIAARAVAEGLVDLALDPDWSSASASAATPIVEIAGPREENLVDLARRLVARRGDSLRIEAPSDPTGPFRNVYEDGGLLPGPEAKLAGPTFDEWLDATFGQEPVGQAAGAG